MELLKPEYNILKKAGSLKGYKHTEDTMRKFDKRTVSKETRNNLSLAAKKRILTEEEKAKISLALSGREVSSEKRAKISASITHLYGKPVQVKNVESNEVKEFRSVTLAANFLEVSRTAVNKAISAKRLLRKK